MPAVFAVPTLALLAGLFGGRLAVNLPGALRSEWTSATVKVTVFSVLYVGILFALERDNVKMLLDMLSRMRQTKRAEKPDV